MTSLLLINLKSPSRPVIKHFLTCPSRLWGGEAGRGSKFQPLNFSTSFQFVFHKKPTLDILPFRGHWENRWKMKGEVREMFYFEEIKQTLEDDNGKDSTKDRNRVKIGKDQEKRKQRIQGCKE